ncbi:MULTISPECIES: DUF2474 domain-containing protein [Pseudomonas]|uniref:DUF2474 domain-containing protein n=1 Tax=Pseudomonas luteola TaxID=47886 RepID=A0ABS0MQA0_PSELU|nr:MULTISPECIES: DUF2474 domain-containing protein [Pseudomonas]MBH3438898.1 DUF2474 domain-containing protein [Pseudomonas luteola]MDN3234065.1 DUF2474 domain-containing protein [Pseudomonas sp. WAC2]
MAGKERDRKAGPPNPADNQPLIKRLGWMVLIWACSIVALGIVSYGLRLVMTAAGLKS